MDTAYKNILIIKPSALGDIAHTLCILPTIKQNCPDARITWLVREEFAPLIANHPDIDDLIIFRRKLIGKFWKSVSAFKGLINLFKVLKNSKFDLVFDFQGLFRTAFFARVTGCKKRFGFADAREFAPWFYKPAVKSDGLVHVVDCCNKLLSQAGFELADYNPSLKVEDDARLYVDKLLKEADLEKGKYAVIIPGSAHASKCWPAEKFAKLSEFIVKEAGLKIATVGTAGESEIVERISGTTDTKIINFAGKTNIPQLVALINNAKLVISNDTGPGYIAVVLKRPTVLVFGPVNAARLAPYNDFDCVVAIDTYGRPAGIASDDEKYAIEHVTVDMVIEKICSKLDLKPAK